MFMPKLIIWVSKASDPYHIFLILGTLHTCRLPWISQASLGSGEEPELL